MRWGILLVVLLSLPGSLGAQVLLEGRVTDETEGPVAGATVVVEGIDRETTTDAVGRYRLANLPAGRIRLSVRSPGYRDAARAVVVERGRRVLDVRLRRDPIPLEAIVVTGTAGAVTTRSTGNAVARIEAPPILAAAPVGDLAELLRGRAAGIRVTEPGGETGAGSRIRIRGPNSLLLDAAPVVYVDGVRIDSDPSAAAGFGVGGQAPSRLEDLSPSEIERVEIVKGPAAATLYGAEAANGVIQVVTRRGPSGGRQWSVRASAGRARLPDHGLPAQYAAVPESDREGLESRPGVRVLDRLEDGRWLVSNRPVAAVLRTGRSASASATLGVGGEEQSFFLAAHAARDEGPLVANDVRRLGGRANLRWEGVSFGIELGSAYSNNRIRLPWNGTLRAGLLQNALLASPARITDARPWGEPFEALADIAEVDARFTNDRFTGFASANHRIRPWLRHRALLGVDLNVEESIELVPFGLLDETPTGARTNARQTVFDVTLEYRATLEWAAARRLRLGTDVGAQLLSRATDGIEAVGEGFPAPGVETVSATGETSGEEFRVEERGVGLYLQERVAWRDRLYVNAGLRVDDHSAFGPELDLQAYPKIDGSWVIGEEPWFDVPAVTTLRVRSAFGVAGHQPPVLASERLFAATSVRGGDPAVLPLQPAGPDLSPERSREWEWGVDAGLWDDRLAIRATGWRRRTRDALVERLPAPSSGFSSPQLRNVAALSSTGWEVSVRAALVDRPGVGWSVGLEWSGQDSRVESLGGEDPFLLAPFQRVEEGHALGEFYDTVVEGFDESGQPVLSEDPRFLGTGAIPGRWGSLVTEFEVGRWALHAMLDWQSDFLVYDVTRESRYGEGVSREAVDPRALDEPTRAILEAAVRGRTSEPWLESGDFLKLRELSVRWIAPPGWARALGGRSASLGLEGRDLVTWSDYSGADPEVNVLGADGHGYYDLFSTPPARRWLLTLRVEG